MEKRLKEAQGLVEQTEYNKAKEILITLFKERADDDQMYFLLGRCFLETGDNSNAVRFFKKAVALRPHDTDYLIALGSAYEAFGEPIHAMEIYVRVLAGTPDNKVASEGIKRLLYVTEES
ncbi:MAG: hypothetical protein L3J47_04995 [Sulfurovum sp.]|nr:hypothetical protein [Sulfurovum sp.]